MKKNSKKALAPRVTVEEYMKAVKKADRETEYSFNPGWTAKTKIHPSKKVYNRKAHKNIEE
jgi:hypothetical protein